MSTPLTASEHDQMRLAAGRVNPVPVSKPTQKRQLQNYLERLS